MADIMVVEDDEQLNEVLCYNLEKAGYQVSAVYDGEEAVRRLTEHKPDLLLLDIMLPGRSGWEVCQHISERDDLKELPVVIFTAKSAREDFDRARKFPNFAGYFVKPYATPDVMRHVEKILSDRS
jgi:two-component system phosphate regulon response regulator PhoB